MYTKKSIEKIKDVFLKAFARELSEEEAVAALDKMRGHTEAVIQTVPGKSTDKSRNFDAENASIYFSPVAVSEQVDFILANEPELFETHVKYKIAREMMIASRFCISLKKQTGREWAIKGQDVPDIILVSPNGGDWKGKPFDAIKLEVMQIPAREQGNWSEAEVEQKIAEFIKDKKFLKSAGMGALLHLVVHLNFSSTNLNLQKIFEALAKLPGNPFHQIWLLLATSPDWRTHIACLVYPGYKVVQVDLAHDSHLLF